jgi:hypothetical protein
VRLLFIVLLAGCYPVCVTDADCDNGYCQIDGQKRECIACDPDGRPCLDGRVCSAVNMCVACMSDSDCGDGLICADDGTCQSPEAPDDAGASD